MENQIFRDVNTFLDINGPVLSFTTHPTGVTGIGTTAGTTGGGTVELTGIATVSFAVNVELPDTSLYDASSNQISEEAPSVEISTPKLALKSAMVPPEYDV